MHRRCPLIGLVIVVAGIGLVVVSGMAGRAQAPAPVTGLLMGVIVDGVSGQSIANAAVAIGGAVAGVANTKVLTDSEGQFVFLDLPKGTFTITATKPGYNEGAFGRRRPGGLQQTLALADGARLGDLRIPIWRHAAITGTIRDEAGEALVGVPVQVLVPTFRAGRLTLSPGAVVRTDDRGIYRFGALAAGDYVVAVPSTQTTAPHSVVRVFREFGGTNSGQSTMDLYRDMSFSGGLTTLNFLGRGGAGAITVGGLAFLPSVGNMRAAAVSAPSGDAKISVFPTQYFPAAMTAAEATTVTVRSGEERSGIDIQLRLVVASRVSGSVTGPSGPLIAVLTLAPVGEPSTDSGLETARTVSDAEGRFTLLGVPPGRYRLHGVRVEVPPSGAMSRGAPPPTPPGTKRPPPPALPGYSLTATQPLAVDADHLDGLKVIMQPGFRVSGRAEFPGAAPPDPDLVRGMTATFDPADARPLVSSVIGRGQFEENGQLWSYQLPPGRYFLRINNAPVGWTLHSAIWNGQDVSNVPFELDRDVSGLRITFTRRPATLSVQAQDASGAADPTATVLIFPADPNAWVDYGGFPRRLRALRVNGDGRSTEAGLPPGKYLVAAVAEESSANWQNPHTLRELARVATSVALAEGESRQLALRTIVAR